MQHSRILFFATFLVSACGGTNSSPLAGSNGVNGKAEETGGKDKTNNEPTSTTPSVVSVAEAQPLPEKTYADLGFRSAGYRLVGKPTAITRTNDDGKPFKVTLHVEGTLALVLPYGPAAVAVVYQPMEESAPQGKPLLIEDVTVADEVVEFTAPSVGIAQVISYDPSTRSASPTNAVSPTSDNTASSGIDTPTGSGPDVGDPDLAPAVAGVSGNSGDNDPNTVDGTPYPTGPTTTPTTTGPGALRFMVCGTGSDDMCKDAASRTGAGTENTRAFSCGNSVVAGNVGLQVGYDESGWYYYDNGSAVTRCTANSTLVFSTAYPQAGNAANFTLCPDNSTDQVCVQARSNDNRGTDSVRALSCRNSTGDGVVGLQLRYVDGHWQYYDNNSVPTNCVDGTTLVVSAEGGAAGRAEICNNASTSSDVCQRASTGGGNGDGQTRALSCGNAVVTGNVGLQMSFLNGGWGYIDNGSMFVPCVEGTVMVVTWAPGTVP